MPRTEQCACCGRTAEYETKGHTSEGVPIVGLPEGWATIEGLTSLVIDVPWEGDFLLPREVAEAIADFLERTPDGLIGCERLGPEVTVASVREVNSSWLGMVCAECDAEHADWDADEWSRFLAFKRPPEQ
jgi:hypothetical protein